MKKTLKKKVDYNKHKVWLYANESGSTNSGCSFS